MAQFGKSASSKRSKPSYLYAIIGMSVILFLFGIMGWLFLNLRKTKDVVKEKLQIHAWINRLPNKKQVDSMHQYLLSLPYTKDVQYVTKEMAAKIWNENNDSAWKKILDNNPLPESIDFYVKSEYVNKDSLTKLNQTLAANFSEALSEFQYPTEAVTVVNSKYVKIALGAIIGLILLLAAIVIISIDNTIRLAMYSNRFLIKTMQMVGATRFFIARPLDMRAVINGFISALIALAGIYGVVFLIESYIPDFRILRDSSTVIIITGSILFLGIAISLLSTHRSILKYLKMKLDDLY
ncbi:MAG: permease-like cell division protein FtsX [Ferruginibacter sp.]